MLKRLNYETTQVKSFPNDQDSDEDSCDERDNNCIECDENYYKTREKVDWIKCLNCAKWMHESCTMSVSYTHLDVYKRQELPYALYKLIF